MAESFGADPAGYDRARPPYPAELIARIAEGGRAVLDVGCGTGIASRQLQAAGCTVLGVEPDPRMAAYARSRGLAVEVAAFEAWDPAGRVFDAVTAAQSWHWVDPAAGAAKAARVLRPGGRLTVFGHAYEPPPEVAEPFAAAFRRAVPDSPFASQPASQPAARPLARYREMYGAFAAAMTRAAPFAGPEQHAYDWSRRYTRDEWLALLPTTGALTRLPAARLAGILDAVGAAIDALGGGFTMRYTTFAASAVRTA
jgi:SAM-dependent methyltransferase